MQSVATGPERPRLGRHLTQALQLDLEGLVGRVGQLARRSPKYP